MIDLNSDRTSSDRFLKLKHQVNRSDSIVFLPNGDLIQVLLGDRKIYKYCFTDKPKNTDPWEYSQINDIAIPKSLNTKLSCSICRTKLFVFVKSHKTLIHQFDLLTMNLERQYTLNITSCYSVTMNKNQTLLAISFRIFSMENGMHISRYG